MKKLYPFLLALCFYLFGTESHAATNYYLKSSGSPALTTSWGTNTNGTGTNPPSLATASAIWNFRNQVSLSLSAALGFVSTSTVNIGDGSTAITCSLASGGTFGSAKIFINNSATLVLLAGATPAVNNTKPQTGSTIVFSTGSGSVVAFSTNYYNLIIDRSNAINVTAISVDGTLTVNSGFDFSLGGASLNINGAVSGSGAILGDNSASITFAGTGDKGTLNFTSGSEILGSMTLGSSTGSLTLGTNLDIDGGTLSLQGGVLQLNGKDLSVTTLGALDFGGGTISGSSSSGLYFSSVGSVSGLMTMDATNNTLKSLFFNGSGLTLTLGNALNITDSISALDGTIDVSGTGAALTLKATNTLRGRVGMMTYSTTTGVINGSVTVEIFARSNGQFTGWANLGAGGVSGMTVGNWASQIPATCYGCANDPSSAYYFHSIQGYNEADPSGYGYDTTISASTNLTPGEGFWVYLGTGASVTGPITITNSGSLVQGPVSYPVTNTNQGLTNQDGFNLVSNPYASPISFAKLVNANSNIINSNMYLYNTQTGDNYFVLGFTAPDFIIPAGQGFYVSMTDQFNSPSPLNFDESIKTADNSGTSNVLNKTTQSTIGHFKLRLTGSYDSDNTNFYFANGATASYDNYDFRKRFSTPGYVGTASVYDHYTSLSSKLQNVFYAINSLPVLTNSMSIPILARVSATGTYSISIDEVQNFVGCTLLKDNLTGVYHDLANGPYVCTISDTTTYSTRFELALCEMVTTTSVKELKAGLSDIQVLQDNDAAFVTTHFEKNTKATISVFNVVGQQLIDNLEVEGTDTKTRLALNSHNEVLFVRVTTDKETVTKKIVTH